MLQGAQTALKGQMSPSGSNFETTQTYVLNPKSITMGQLYGEFDLLTHEWSVSTGQRSTRRSKTPFTVFKIIFFIKTFCVFNVALFCRRFSYFTATKIQIVHYLRIISSEIVKRTYTALSIDAKL